VFQVSFTVGGPSVSDLTLSKWQQFVDFAVRPSREFFQGVFQPSRRIKAIEFGGSEQALNGGSPLTGAFGTDEEPVFPA
jgi:hypothetical protein